MARVKVLIFDVDLTLCNNLLRKAKAIERATGVKIPENFMELVEHDYGFERTLRALGVLKWDKDILDSILTHFFYDLDLYDLDEPLEGAVETLRKLYGEGYKLYYVTGRPYRETVKKFLDMYGFPPGQVLADKVGPGESWRKVALFRKILDAEKLLPGEFMAIGDLPGDARAAKELGITAIGVCQVHKSMREELKAVCDRVLNSLSELPEVLKEVR